MATLHTEHGTVRTATQRRYVIVRFMVMQTADAIVPGIVGYTDSLETGRARLRRMQNKLGEFTRRDFFRLYDLTTGETA